MLQQGRVVKRPAFKSRVADVDFEIRYNDFFTREIFIEPTMIRTKLAALILCVLSVTTLNAEEGMFPISSIDRLGLAEKGMQLTAKQIFNPDSGVRLNDYQIVNHFPNHYELTRCVILVMLSHEKPQRSHICFVSLLQEGPHGEEC